MEHAEAQGREKVQEIKYVWLVQDRQGGVYTSVWRYKKGAVKFLKSNGYRHIGDGWWKPKDLKQESDSLEWDIVLDKFQVLQSTN